GEFETAKKYCVEALRLSSQEEALLECMRGINRELIRMYEARLKEGSASERDILELGWCYLQNEEAGKGVQLLEGRTVGSGEEGEYHNLLSKCCFVERRYQDAAAEARRCISCIREEAAAREEEAAEEERGKETAKIPGR